MDDQKDSDVSAARYELCAAARTYVGVKRDFGPGHDLAHKSRVMFEEAAEAFYEVTERVWGQTEPRKVQDLERGA